MAYDCIHKAQGLGNGNIFWEADIKHIKTEKKDYKPEDRSIKIIQSKGKGKIF